MKTFSYVITDELGIHARPAGMMAKEAKKFTSEIKIRKGDKEVVASHVLMLMGLGIKKEDEVEITIQGSDEEEAYNAILSFLKQNL